MADGESSETREKDLASKKLDRELAETTIALARLRDEQSPDRIAHERRLAWARLFSAPVIVIVTALTAYCGVNRHAQIVADEELAIKKFEVETTLRYGIVKDYLALPSDTSRSRLDMLSFIEETDDRPAIKTWARARREELQKSIADEANFQRQLRGAFAQAGVRPPNPGDWILWCSTTVPATASTQQMSTELSFPGPQKFTEEEARAKCQSFADEQCKHVGLDGSKCQPHFEILPPGSPPH